MLPPSGRNWQLIYPNSIWHRDIQQYDTSRSGIQNNAIAIKCSRAESIFILFCWLS
jgi:hypothetical protein